MWSLTEEEEYGDRRMTKAKKKQLMDSAPWRVDDGADDEFKDAKLKVTSQGDGNSTMHVPRKKSVRSKDQDPDDSVTEIDPELRYSFQRNFQVLVLSIFCSLYHSGCPRIWVSFVSY